MIRRISQLICGRLSTLAAAVAGAIALVGCAVPPDQAGSATDQATGTGGAMPAQNARAAAKPSSAIAANIASISPAAAPPAKAAPSEPTKTITLPDRGHVSLAEYRAQMREQLMKTENAAPDVADCAAHASWVVPRSTRFDALKIPTGALAAGQATSESWSGRFSQGKQAVPVTSVVTFSATAHKRGRSDEWETVKARCGYDDGMMLAYELLDSNGTAIADAGAAPAPAARAGRHHGAATRAHRGGKATTAKATSKSAKPSTAKSTAGKSSAKSGGTAAKGKSTGKKQH
ncbi:BspC domain-containing protein [Cupriavidus sp. USMAA2-4]|uniref:BspC domain-containing protein n=1 Tax=Cupriavidus sp. USMAA2-4 TaxID=876364 RepID=UPI001E45B7E3|nr:hypothetical protein [Cupriavidus sp. USMAA2-4]